MELIIGGTRVSKIDELEIEVMSSETELLNTLKSIDGTLKRIEQSLSAEKQHEVIKEAVSHAMLGEKYDSTPKDFS